MPLLRSAYRLRRVPSFHFPACGTTTFSSGIGPIWLNTSHYPHLTWNRSTAQRTSFKRVFHHHLITMAWTCSGRTNSELIENMWREDLINDAKIKAAFLKVDRAHYSPVRPYEDSPQSIGHAATISAPHMHASACEHLLPFLLPVSTSSSSSSPGRPKRILDVGSGSGYLTHVLAELAGDKAVVVGLEHIRELKELGEVNMGKGEEGKELLRSGRVKFRLGDGRLGWKEGEDGEEGWDVIHVGASAKEVHAELIKQLRAPGCLFIPVDDDEWGESQHVWKIFKHTDGKVISEKLFEVRYVALTNAPNSS